MNLWCYCIGTKRLKKMGEEGRWESENQDYKIWKTYSRRETLRVLSVSCFLPIFPSVFLILSHLRCRSIPPCLSEILFVSMHSMFFFFCHDEKKLQRYSPSPSSGDCDFWSLFSLTNQMRPQLGFFHDHPSGCKLRGRESSLASYLWIWTDRREIKARSQTWATQCVQNPQMKQRIRWHVLRLGCKVSSLTCSSPFLRLHCATVPLNRHHWINLTHTDFLIIILETNKGSLLHKSNVSLLFFNRMVLIWASLVLPPGFFLLRGVYFLGGGFSPPTTACFNAFFIHRQKAEFSHLPKCTGAKSTRKHK